MAGTGGAVTSVLRVAMALRRRGASGADTTASSAFISGESGQAILDAVEEAVRI